MEEDCESPPTSHFFSRRAQFFPKKTAEELQAAAELVEKIQGENSNILNVETTIPNKKQKTKGKKQLKSSNDIEDETEDLYNIHNVSLSASAKRRLQKMHAELELERQLVEAQNEKILSAMDSSVLNDAIIEIDEDFKKIAVLSIKHMSKISRLKCYESDKFVDIIPKVAELLDLKVTDFLLCLREKNISVDDTPKSLEITNHDVLECIPYRADENSKAETEDNGNTFKVFFQSNDSKKKVDMLVHKVEKMKEIMKRYSEQRNIPVNQLIFDFDGERLTGDETPAELDMESESCIDVTVATPAELEIESESSIDVESESSIDVTVIFSSSPAKIPAGSSSSPKKPAGRGRKRSSSSPKTRGRGRKRGGRKW